MGNLQSNLANNILLEALPYIESNSEEDCEENDKEKLGNRHRNRQDALEEVGNLSESAFSSMFRMTRPGFQNLLERISPFLPDVDERMAKLSSGSMITKSTKLYATLRYLAGGSFHDICFGWRIAKSTFFSHDPNKGVIWPTMKAIDDSFFIGLPVNDEAKLESMATEFSCFANGELHGCVTAIDGWVAQTRKPMRSEV
jgi:hypothetical protein